MFTSRKCLEAMTTHYADEWFTDAHEPDKPHETIALFRQVMTDPVQLPGSGARYRELYSEDYSFCHRWRRMGGRVYMFVGEGAPLGHVGGHVFSGDRSEMGNVR